MCRVLSCPFSGSGDIFFTPIDYEYGVYHVEIAVGLPSPLYVIDYYAGTDDEVEALRMAKDFWNERASGGLVGSDI